MKYRTKKTITKQATSQKYKLENSSNTKFHEILYSEKLLNIIEGCRDYRERVFSPFTTLMLFIKQVLDSDKSCKKAISKLNAESMGLHQQTACANHTGSYCKARTKLPEETIHSLVEETGKDTENLALRDWKWKGRNIKVVDGSTILMPDTSKNQAIYPQHAQKEGVGFPIMRVIAVFSLSLGTVLNYAMAPMKGKSTGEPSLLRQIMGKTLQTGDVLLGDSCFHSFFLLIDLLEIGCDCVFEAHAQWKYDLKTAKKLGKNDYIVTWKKPQRPEWMEKEDYKGYPEDIKVRVCEASGKVFITTLLSDKTYHKKEISQLYKLRWHAELYFRNIKTVMQMDMLSCKSPAMVRKELGIHLLAYNVIRILMAESGITYNVPPSEISFKNTIQLLNSFMPVLIFMSQQRMEIYNQLLFSISNTRVGNRPGRREPRAVKRRPKDFRLLTRPRHLYNKESDRTDKSRIA